MWVSSGAGERASINACASLGFGLSGRVGGEVGTLSTESIGEVIYGEVA
jgi:hypothetical protein